MNRNGNGRVLGKKTDFYERSCRLEALEERALLSAVTWETDGYSLSANTLSQTENRSSMPLAETSLGLMSTESTITRTTNKVGIQAGDKIYTKQNGVSAESLLSIRYYDGILRASGSIMGSLQFSNSPVSYRISGNQTILIIRVNNILTHQLTMNTNGQSVLVTAIATTAANPIVNKYDGTFYKTCISPRPVLLDNVRLSCGGDHPYIGQPITATVNLMDTSIPLKEADITYIWRRSNYYGDETSLIPIALHIPLLREMKDIPFRVRQSVEIQKVVLLGKWKMMILPFEALP